MKWLVRIAVVIVVLLVVADFGARIVVENVAGRALASRRGFNGEVDVGFGGFPFLLALMDRHFDEVTVTAEDVRSGGFTGTAVADGPEIRVDSVRFEMQDVTVTGDLWGDDPNREVTAAEGSGRAVVRQSALNQLVPAEYDLRLTLLQDTVRITGTAPQLPQAGTQTVEVPSDQVRLEASTLVVPAPAPVGEIRIPLPELAEGVEFESVGVTRGEIDLTFSVRGLRLEL